MCGGSAPKQKPSAHEIALAGISRDQNAQYEQTFVPLEAFAIEQFRDPAVRKMNESIMGGRQNADVAAAELDAQRSVLQQAMATNTGVGSGRNVAQLSEIGNDVSIGLRRASVDSAEAARSIQDQEGLAAVKTGQGLSRGVIDSVGSLARADNFRGSAKLRAKTENRAALTDAIASVGTAAAIRADRAYRKSAEDKAAAASKPSLATLYGDTRAAQDFNARYGAIG